MNKQSFEESDNLDSLKLSENDELYFLHWPGNNFCGDSEASFLQSIISL